MIRFEARGCGRSDWDGNYDVETLINDVEMIRQAYGVERWIVGGHSAGPDFALAYAMKFPERTLGVIAIAGGRFVNDRDWSQVYQQKLALHEEENGGLVFTADKSVNLECNKSWKQYIKQPSVFRDLSKLSMPCVFIGSERDIRPNWPTRQIAMLIPQAIYVEIPGANHYAWITHGRLLRAELQMALRHIRG